MEKNERSSKDYYVIDLLHIVKSLWRRAWAILLISIVCGAMALSYTHFFVPPQYSSSVLLYVNNNMSVGDIPVSFTTSSISASKALVNTYIVIMKSRTTLENVVQDSDWDVSWGELYGMIRAEAVNDTEIFRVTVTADDPVKAADLANGIAKELPGRVKYVMDGCSMRVVDPAIVNPGKVSPSLSTNTAIGLALGFILSCLLFAVLAMMDDTIHSEDHLVQNYDVPILAKIPDLLFEESTRKYSYYYSGYGSKDKKAQDASSADNEQKEG